MNLCYWEKTAQGRSLNCLHTIVLRLQFLRKKGTKSLYFTGSFRNILYFYICLIRTVRSKLIGTFFIIRLTWHTFRSSFFTSLLLVFLYEWKHYLTYWICNIYVLTIVCLTNDVLGIRPVRKARRLRNTCRKSRNTAFVWSNPLEYTSNTTANMNLVISV